MYFGILKPFSTIPKSLHIPSLVLLLVVFIDDVFEEREKGFLTALIPGFHKSSVALAGRRAAPAEMVHFVGPILFLLLVRDVLFQGVVDIVGGQLTPHLSWEGLCRFLLYAVGVDLNGPALASHWLAPTEMLHGVRALVLVPGAGLRCPLIQGGAECKGG